MSKKNNKARAAMLASKRARITEQAAMLVSSNELCHRARLIIGRADERADDSFYYDAGSADYIKHSQAGSGLSDAGSSELSSRLNGLLAIQASNSKIPAKRAYGLIIAMRRAAQAHVNAIIGSARQLERLPHYEIRGIHADTPQAKPVIITRNILYNELIVGESGVQSSPAYFDYQITRTRTGSLKLTRKPGSSSLKRVKPDYLGLTYRPEPSELDLSQARARADNRACHELESRAYKASRARLLSTIQVKAASRSVMTALQSGLASIDHRAERLSTKLLSQQASLELCFLLRAYRLTMSPSTNNSLASRA